MPERPNASEQSVDCQRAEQLISASIDAELDAGGRAALDAHLAACAACRETENAARRQHEALREAFAVPRASAARVADRIARQWQTTRPPQAAQPPWLPMLLSAAAGFLLAVMIWRPWLNSDVAAIPPVAHLGLSVGQIEVLRPGRNEWEYLKAGEAVEAGAAVRTGPESLCEWTTSEGALVRMNGDTQLHFADRNAVTLAAGQVFTCPTAQAPLSVETSDAKVTAVDGQFDLQCAPDTQRVVVTSVRGDADVRAHGQSKKITGGQSVEVADGAIVQRRPVVDLIMATNWIHEILAQKDEDDPELTARVDAMLASLGEVKMSYLYEEEIRAMGAKCAVPLSRFIQSAEADSQALKRRNAARILADIAPSGAVGELISLLKDPDGEVRAQAARGLTRLTGQDQGMPAAQWSSPWSACESTHQKWLTWWEANKPRYRQRQ